jgi:hypothetical protein
MRGRLLIAAAVALIGIVFAVGCGDDEDTTANDSGSNPAAQTTEEEATDGGSTEGGDDGDDGESEGGSEKEEFIAQANELCDQRTKEIQTEGQKAFKRLYNEPEEVGAKKLGQEVIVPIFSRELRELKALDQPAGDEAELEAIYREIEDVIDYFEGNPDPDVYPYNKAENMAKRYGIERCGTPQ